MCPCVRDIALVPRGRLEREKEARVPRAVAGFSVFCYYTYLSKDKVGLVNLPLPVWAWLISVSGGEDAVWWSIRVGQDTHMVGDPHYYCSPTATYPYP